MSLLFSLWNNVVNAFTYLQHDLNGQSLDLSILVIFFKNIVILLLLIFIFYVIGKYILERFTNLSSNYVYLVYIAVGYILVSTFISTLGLFSLLNKSILLLFTIALIFFTFFCSFKPNIKTLYSSIVNTCSNFKNHKLVFTLILLFVFLGVINLINPEIREDQYHVDLPRLYLQNNTILLPAKEGLHVSASPQMAEMYYLLGIFLSSKETPRYLHFAFYLLTLLSLTSFAGLRKYKFSIYAPLIFASAPVVIHETSTFYTDFEWIFLLLLSLLLIIDKPKEIKLAGLLFGGMIATKLWTIAFSIPSLLFLLIFPSKTKINYRVKQLIIYGFFATMVSIIWFLRSYYLTNNFFYPAFIKEVSLDKSVWDFPISHFFTFNTILINPLNFINVFSPLFFLGCFFIIFRLTQNIKTLNKLLLFPYFIFIFILYLFINYPYGRYLLGLYVFFIFIASLGIDTFFKKIKFIKYVAFMGLILFYLYYLINAMLILPYSFGIADKNKYLTRILIRDNSSYFDFERRFDKYITKKDLVAMYNIHGYYYADFKYIDINFIFDKDHKDFNLLKRNGITKFFIRGGDINWFCKEIGIYRCTYDKYKLISNYMIYPYYYLYKIN